MTAALWVYVIAGTIILWAKLKAEQRKVYCLTEVVSKFVSNEKIKSIIELAIFLLLGYLLSMGIVQPTTPAQALAAGLAWTGLTTR